MNEPASQTRLQELEVIIERYRSYGIEAGLALKEIKDSELWKETHASFVEYAQERWNIGKSYAYQLISDAQTAKQLKESGQSAFAENLKPFQARELAKVEPEKRAEVLQQAAEANGGEVTAKAIKEAAKPKREPKPAKVLAVETPKEEDIKAQATQAVDEMQVAIEDLKIVIDKLSDFEVEPETCEACAEELTKTARLLRRLAKAKGQ